MQKRSKPASGGKAKASPAIRGNVVIDPPDGPPARIDPAVADGFWRHRPEASHGVCPR